MSQHADRFTLKLAAAALLLALMSACSVNPVTGERQFMTVSTESDLQLGERNYRPMQQSQGGLHDVDPVLTAYVSSVGARLAAESGVALPYEFVVLNNSVPNAWALPGGKIAINRGLLTELQSEAELAAVLGHEIVHAAARHSAQQRSRSMIMAGLVVATAAVASDGDYGELAVGGASTAAALITQKYGRGAELESDRYGMQYMSKAGYDPVGAVYLQETFVRLNDSHQPDWVSGLFASHPPSQDRVNANRATAAMLPEGGILGKEAFQRAMRITLDAGPAYAAYDEGRKALSENKPEEALALANKALKLFPEEANFHALRGDVRLLEHNYEWAVTNYTRALDRRDGFFYYYVQRGIAKKELQQIDGSVSDLERSIELLPTVPAHFMLGEISEQRGQTTVAIKHYRLISTSGGKYGKAAAEALARLESATNPAANVSH
ncbi:MAG: M48 family metalloprotease [Proteobacteria bacterium]|nr:M48 family metalloprotease [Pseudomonadota bacterium]